jgi:Uma2 family endonuclease
MVSVEEYLTTSYEAEREYADGELLERHTGEQPHARAHAAVGSLIFQQEARLGIRALMSQRIQVGPTRFRVPDVCVLPASAPRDPIVRQAPFLCIEILSPEDRVLRLNDRISDYSRWVFVTFG